MKNKDIQLVYHINKLYNELTEEFNLIKNFEEFSSKKYKKSNYFRFDSNWRKCK